MKYITSYCNTMEEPPVLMPGTGIFAPTAAERRRMVPWMDLEYYKQLTREKNRKMLSEPPTYGHLSPTGTLLAEQIGLSTCIDHVIRTAEVPTLSCGEPKATQMSFEMPTGAWCLFHGNSQREQLPFKDTAAFAIFSKNVSTNSILQCERCEECFDVHFNHVSWDEISPATLTNTMSYAYCPMNFDNKCKSKARGNWKWQLQRLEAERKAVFRSYLDIVIVHPPMEISESILQIQPTPGGEEIRWGYLAWRRIWYDTIFRPCENSKDRCTRKDPWIADIFPDLRMWGDLRNDYELYKRKYLTAKTLTYAYELSPQAIVYLLENPLYEDEIQWLNDFVGMRRQMPSEQFKVAKRAVQRLGTAMTKLLQYEEAVAKEPTQEWHLQGRANWQRIALRRFRELHSAVVVDLASLTRRMPEGTGAGPWQC